MWSRVWQALFAIGLGLLVTSAQKPSQLQTLIMGRCTEWSVMNAAQGLDCTKVWTNFEAIISDTRLEKLCTMDPGLFKPLVDILTPYFEHIENPYLWSKTYALVRGVCHDVGACMTLESTILGYILDGLNWCDIRLTGGKVYKTGCGCDGKAQLVFSYWKLVSDMFSKSVTGTVGIILNGSVPLPYDRERTLGAIELKNLNATRVKKVNAYLVHDLTNRGIYETCLSRSIIELQKDIKDKGIPFECHEDPPFIMHYQCIWNPQYESCKLPN